MFDIFADLPARLVRAWSHLMEVIFLSDGRYTEQANQEVKGCTIHIGTHNHFQTAKNEGLIPDGLNLAFEKDRVTVGQYDIIQSLLPKTKWQLVSQ